MIYLYGLLQTGFPGPTAIAETLTGVTGPIQTQALPQGILVYGPHDGSEILAKRRFMLAHARVLEAFLQAGTVLPMRFGMISESVEEVAELLTAQAELVTEQMSKLGGLVEIGLRIDFDKDTALAQQLERWDVLKTERDRLLVQSRGDHFRQAEFGRKLGDALDRHRTDAQHQVVKSLSDRVKDMVVRAPEHDVQVLSADVLIARGTEDELTENVTEILNGVDFGGGAEPQIKLIGPEPPYNFVRLSLAQAGAAG